MKNKFNFRNLEYSIQSFMLGGSLNFSMLLDKFISDIKIKSKISVIANIKQVNGNHYSLGTRYPLDLGNIEDVKNYVEFLNGKYSMLDNRYKVVPAIIIYFNYTVINDELYEKTQNIFKGQISSIKALDSIDISQEQTINLPLNTKYFIWGAINEWLDTTKLVVKNLTIDKGTNVSRYLIVDLLDNFNSSISVFIENSKVKLTDFTDRIENKLTGEFIRNIGNKYYHILDNKVFFVFERLVHKNKTITRARTSKKVSLNMLTLDIETYVDSDNNMQIYCVSFYTGNKTYNYYISDFTSVDQLLNQLLSVLLTREFTQKTVYIHNSSDFDLIFILKHVINYPGVNAEPVIKDGKFINLKITYGPKNTYYINFKDSYLLLPAALSKLAKQFNVDTLKDIFPHKFVTKDNLNYAGDVPGYEYFDSTKVSKEEYLAYCERFKNRNWSIRGESTKYCEIDCISLFNVIQTFAGEIFYKFDINISSVSTLPSLAFKIFRAHYLSKSINLPVLTGKIYDDISQAYYGGHVDMYVPTNIEGENVYQYDVNSLYPFAMKEYKYPTKILAYFKGDITKMNLYVELFNKHLSIIKVKVTSPKNILHPILPVKVDDTTIYPEGKWTAWYYSEEINNAKKYGYQFEILEGYLFEGADLFSKYVDDLYKLKEKSDPKSPMYTIAKLILNTVYGKFGMKPELLIHEIVDASKLSDLIDKIGLENLVNVTDIGLKSLVSYRSRFPRVPMINVSVAAAITANARIYMAEKTKNKSEFMLYYSDTDSAFTSKPLPSNLIDNKKLGLFKLEKVLTKFVALAPKVYGGIEVNGNEYTKVKGLKTNVSLLQLEELLIKNSSKDVKQEKWSKDLKNCTIKINSPDYNIKPTDNKRILVYKDNILVGTANKVLDL